MENEQKTIGSDMESVINWLAALKWIEGTSINHPDYFRLSLSQLGAKRFDEIAEILAPFGRALNGGPKPGADDYKTVIERLSLIALEDMRHLPEWPTLSSDNQMNMVFAIAMLRSQNAAGRTVCFPKS